MTKIKKTQSPEQLSFMKRLKECFDTQPVSKKDIQRALGVSYTTVHNWFSTGEIEKTNVYRLADFLKCDRVWLLTGSNKSNKNAHLDPDPFLVECVKFIVKLPGTSNMNNDEVNELIKDVYKDGFDTKKINLDLIMNLM